MRWGYAFSALLAVIGQGLFAMIQVTDHFSTGLLLVQLCNITFAIGVVGTNTLMETRPMPQHNAFAWFYLGAFLVAVIAWFLLGNAQNPRKPRCNGAFWCFLAWWLPGSAFSVNYGATQVNACGTLGIMNNMRVPAGLLVNLAIWHQQPHWPTLITGALVILASLWVRDMGRSALFTKRQIIAGVIARSAKNASVIG